MAAIRKSNLRGKKRWLGRDSTRQETNFRAYKVNENTNLPPLPKPAPEFLSRQRRSTPSFWSKSSSSVVSSNSVSAKVKSQRLNKSVNKNEGKKMPVVAAMAPQNPDN